MNLHLLSDLRQAVEDEYGCLATLNRIVRVVEKLEGGTVWECDVAVFTLVDHPTADITPSPTAHLPRRRIQAGIACEPCPPPVPVGPIG